MNIKKHGFQQTVQYFAYNDCVLRAAHRHQWLAFFDVDEFLVPVLNATSNAAHSGHIPTVQELLAPFEPYGGVGVTWRMFGTSGHKTRPKDALVTSAYTSCYSPENPAQQLLVKVIANTKYMESISPTCPHMVKYKSDDHYTVDVTKTRISGHGAKQPQNQHMVLHHYVIKSISEFTQKMARGGSAGNRRTEHFLHLVEKASNHTCFDATSISAAFNLNSKVAQVMRK